ncbi:MAG: tRNA (adenosine(37)-N6)-threonylcarbamoyltransferase complex ATPase subunit type 1 TsaE [Omnitrophica WOR_2 bacterium RIFCSPHIGHO2_02_FULL_48_11]|nr:MAG: tRNA (adenosine(37)-N6)-threonylcarbamoyltransferase complex ATPase subunit type 1 TsaE [Omnitrophica WOR_2 bacterium RIFCSPHIGHO2_02_FULL_48_11]
MKSFEYLSQSEKETLRLGAELAPYLRWGSIVCLFGDLGSGKTTFTKGIAQGLKINQKKVNSPTFVLLNIYAGKKPLYHFDLYRMEETGEILNIGYEEFLYGDGVAVVEWADKLGDLMPKEYMSVTFVHQDNNNRLIQFEPRGKHYVGMLKKMSQSRGGMKSKIK